MILECKCRRPASDGQLCWWRLPGPECGWERPPRPRVRWHSSRRMPREASKRLQDLLVEGCRLEDFLRNGIREHYGTRVPELCLVLPGTLTALKRGYDEVEGSEPRLCRGGSR